MRLQHHHFAHPVTSPRGCEALQGAAGSKGRAPLCIPSHWVMSCAKSPLPMCGCSPSERQGREGSCVVPHMSDLGFLWSRRKEQISLLQAFSSATAPRCCGAVQAELAAFGAHTWGAQPLLQSPAVLRCPTHGAQGLPSSSRAASHEVFPVLGSAFPMEFTGPSVESEWGRNTGGGRGVQSSALGPSCC